MTSRHAELRHKRGFVLLRRDGAGRSECGSTDAVATPVPLLTDTRNLTFFHDPVSIPEQPAKLQGVLFSSHAIKRARLVGSISGGITGTDRSRDPSDGVWTSASL